MIFRNYLPLFHKLFCGYCGKLLWKNPQNSHILALCEKKIRKLSTVLDVDCVEKEHSLLFRTLEFIPIFWLFFPNCILPALPSFF